jgi:hypothetical protein
MFPFQSPVFRKVVPMRTGKLKVGLVIVATMSLGSLSAWAVDPPPAAKSAPAQPTYVCPMHPQIQATFPGACPLCKMALKPTNVDASATAVPMNGHAHSEMNMGGMEMMNCPHCTMGMGSMSRAPSSASGTLKVVPGGYRATGGRRCGC